MSSPADAAGKRWPTVVAGVVAAVVPLALMLPTVVDKPSLTNDAAEHLSIAGALVGGQGWQDPILWHLYPPDPPPLPAPAMRAPIPPLLFALPLALGATVVSVHLIHSTLVGLFAFLWVWVLRRWMHPLLALASAVGMFWSWGFWKNGRLLWIDALGTCALFGVVVTARGVVTTSRRAALCAALTFVAFWIRPNLGALVVAVAVAAALELGRDFWKSRPLLTYVGLFALLVVVSNVVVSAATGYAPYAGYGMQSQVFHAQDAAKLQHEFPGAVAFAKANWEEATSRWSKNVVTLLRMLFYYSRFHRPGYVLVPLLLFGFWMRSDTRLEQRVCAFGAVGFSLVIIFGYVFDTTRYPMPVVACCWIGGMAAIARIREWVLERAPAFRYREQLPFVTAVLPLVIILGVFVGQTIWMTAPRVLDGYGDLAAGRRGRVSWRLWGTLGMCPHVPHEARVAAWRPWSYAFWCGNAAVRLPSDLENEALLQRFLDERQPHFLVLRDKRDDLAHETLAAAPHLVEQVHTEGEYTLFRVRAQPPPIEGWQGMAPPACLGRPAACRARFGRLSPGEEAPVSVAASTETEGVGERETMR